jgi:hypothetical protein
MLAGSAGTAANEDHHHGHRMTTPAAAPPPVESSNADEVIAALGALLIAGTAAAAVIKLLGTLQGVTKAVVPALFTARKLGKLLGKKLTDPGQKAVTSAQIRYVAAQQQAMARAAYIVRATQRLAPAYATKDPAVIAAAQQREDTFAVAHAKAAADRQTAVNNLIKAVGKTKPDSDGRILMGWYAEPFPCPTCLLADGCDFDVLDPPSIGWPGWVHPHCHCTAGRRHPNRGTRRDPFAGSVHRGTRQRAAGHQERPEAVEVAHLRGRHGALRRQPAPVAGAGGLPDQQGRARRAGQGRSHEHHDGHGSR